MPPGQRESVRAAGAEDVRGRSTSRAIAELADHLACQGIELVAMEWTSDYRRPYFCLLEARGLRCWLVNARDVKSVPGRPTGERSLSNAGHDEQDRTR